LLQQFGKRRIGPLPAVQHHSFRSLSALALARCAAEVEVLDALRREIHEGLNVVEQLQVSGRAGALPRHRL
jgi:hypothetical protein